MGSIPNLTLNNGLEIPQLGFGVFHSQQQRLHAQAHFAGFVQERGAVVRRPRTGPACRDTRR